MLIWGLETSVRKLSRAIRQVLRISGLHDHASRVLERAGFPAIILSDAD